MRSFVHAKDYGATAAAESALSRLCAAGEIRRVRKGLYWKGPKTPLGMPLPDPEFVALEVGGPGSGPAGIAAAQWLGLTTQVPGTPRVAVPGRVPMPVPGVKWVSRPFVRRELALAPVEVALVEVLRDWPSGVEGEWKDLVASTAELISKGEVHVERVSSDIASERRTALRERWSVLLDDMALAS